MLEVYNQDNSQQPKDTTQPPNKRSLRNLSKTRCTNKRTQNNPPPIRDLYAMLARQGIQLRQGAQPKQRTTTHTPIKDLYAMLEVYDSTISLCKCTTKTTHNQDNAQQRQRRTAHTPIRDILQSFCNLSKTRCTNKTTYLQVQIVHTYILYTKECKDKSKMCTTMIR